MVDKEEVERAKMEDRYRINREGRRGVRGQVRFKKGESQRSCRSGEPGEAVCLGEEGGRHVCLGQGHPPPLTLAFPCIPKRYIYLGWYSVGGDLTVRRIRIRIKKIY